MSGSARLTITATLPAAGVIVASLAGALVVVLALALLMRRRPQALPLLAIMTLPFRLPIAADGRTVNLLIPLYLVVAAGTLSQLLPRLLARWRRAVPDDDGARRTRSSGEPGVSLGKPSTWASPRGLELLLLASILLYVLQASYSGDHAKAAENIAFFYVPFGLLFLLLRNVEWTRELLLACLGVAVGLAILFAGVGFVEYYRKTLFLNPKVVAANQYDNYFRVNSVFFDPSIYGRFLAVVMIALTTVVLWSRRRWDVRGTIYVSTILLALGALVLLAAPARFHFGLKGSGGSTNNATSGRTNLISGGLQLFAKRPLQGYGSGSFESAYERHSKTSAENATSASHTIPITVAAEQGIVGLAAYAALLIVALLVLFRGAGRSPPRIAIAACFAALVLHTWTYADFLEDPLTWTLLGIGVACARAGASIWETPVSSV
jgi:hypothetical protein